MSTLFNLSSILNENTIFDNIVQKNHSETYLSTALTNLQEMNTELNTSLSELYSGVQEAESTAAENKVFASYFKQYMDIVKASQRKLMEEVSRFIISIDTFVDANSELIDKASTAFINKTDYPSINLINYTNLNNPEIPKISPYKVFKKEYRFLGKLLQDLGPSANDETRVKVIASVYNNLVTEINNDWLEKVITKLTQSENVDKSNFAEFIYKQFVPEQKANLVSITPPVMQQARFALLDYKDLVDGIHDVIEEFNSEVNDVATELGALLFRNEDYMLDIKTDVDGIADRKYRLTEYSFNQVNQFMKVKANQLTEICNLFTIAISIKMDCIMKYLIQNKNVLETLTYSTDIPEDDVNTSNDTLPDDISATPATDGNETPDDFDNLEDGDDIGSEEPTPTDDTSDGNNTAIGENEPESEDIESDEEVKVETECYLFEAQQFCLNRIIDDISINEQLYVLLSEDATPTKASTASSSSIKNLIIKIINAVVDQVKRFLDTITRNYTKRIQMVDKKRAKLEAITQDNIPDDWTIQAVDFDKLKALKLTRSYQESDNDDLKDTNEYFKKYYPSLATDLVNGKAKSIKDSIVNSVIDQTERKFEVKDITAGLQYITQDFKVLQDSVSKELKYIEDNKRNLEKLSSLPTSTPASEASSLFADDIAKYFTEDAVGDKKTAGDDKNADTAKKPVNNDTAIKNYVTVSTTILTAKMGLIITALKKYDKFFNALVPDTSVN